MRGTVAKNLRRTSGNVRERHYKVRVHAGRFFTQSAVVVGAIKWVRVYGEGLQHTRYNAPGAPRAVYRRAKRIWNTTKRPYRGESWAIGTVTALAAGR